MKCRYFGNDEINDNSLEVIEYTRGAGIKFNDDKCILRLNIDNLYTLVGAILVQIKQVPLSRFGQPKTSNS